MMIIKAHGIFLFLILTVAARAQSSEPLDLAKKIFGKDSVTGMSRYVTGEYTGHPDGRDLQTGSTTKFLLLEQTDDRAVVDMTILDSTGKGIDTYLHFQKDTAWKMNAFRSLAMTGIIEEIKAQVDAMTPQQVHDMIRESKKSKKAKASSLFSSKEEFNFISGNLNLTLALDDSIVAHFIKHQAEFEKLKDLAIKELGGKKTAGERETKLIGQLKQDYQALFISSVSYGSGMGSCLNFLIGGMLDNTVGYMYVKDKKDLPVVNPSRIIMLREIGKGWYMYKTT